MQFEILGSLRVVNESRVLTISARKMEIVLATLLIRAGQIVSVDQLIGEVWGEAPPRRATATLYVYISQLRKLLYSTSGEMPGLETRAPGYLLTADDDALDFHRFQRLVNDGRMHSRAGRHDQARRFFEPALALWRGPVLVDLRDGPIINGFATWLDEVRLEVSEVLNEAHLDIGRHRELVGALYGPVREHPFHEAFYRQLMLAVSRSERRADALRVFQDARAVLDGELGIEPGPRLQSVQREVFNESDRPDADLRAAV